MATLTAYSTSGDGIVRGGSDTSWATARGVSTGVDAFAAQTSGYLPGYAANNAGDANTYFIARGYCAFDLSSIPAGATIQSATLSFYGTGTSGTGGGGTTANNSACIVAGTQASTTTLATSDFGNVGSTELASRVSYSSFGSSGYKDFTLNASGVAHLQSAVGGTVKFAVRPGYDLDNTAPGNTAFSYGLAYFSEQTGTSNDPKLVVTYTTDKLTSDAWAWSDVAAPYRRAIAEVEVWAEGANTQLNGGVTVGATLTVDSTADFPSSGTIWIYDQADYSQAYATYTGKTGTTFTGCSWTSVIGDLAFPDNCGVSAVDAETHFPQIVALDDVSTNSIPELMITAKQGAGHGHVNGHLVKKHSTDGGITWGSSTTFQSAVGSASNRGIFGHTSLRLKNGRILIMWYEHDLSYATSPGSTGPVYNYMIYSDDRGSTWSSPALMDLNFGYSNRDGYTAFGSMLYTGAGSNSTYGDVYVPITGNKDGITVHTSGETYRWETWLYKITDGGASGTVTKVAEVFRYSDIGRAAGEGDIVQAANGDWIMQVRVEPTSGSPDFNDQDQRDRWQSRSTDQGATWSTPAKVIDGFANGAVLYRLPEGVLLSTGSPILSSRDTPNTGQTGSFLSGDNGVSWNSTAKWEAIDATYSVYNGASFEGIINDSTVSRNTVFTYAQERSNQAGARTMFRWYVNPAAKSTSDSWAWSDSAAHAGVTKPRTTSDTWAWSDSTPVNVTKTTSDTWAWSDSVARVAAFTRLTVEHPTSGANSEYWVWSDVAVRTFTLYYSRTTSDVWAWSDATVGVPAYPRTTSDAWAWGDAVATSTGPLYYSRTTADTWRWADWAARDGGASFFWMTRRRDMSTPTKTYKQVIPKGTARTTSFTSDTYVAPTEAGILVVLDVTSASGTGGLTVRINAHDQASAQAVPLNAAPSAVTATGTTSYALYPFGAVAGGVTQATSFYLPRMFSISVTHGDSSSYTYSLGYCLLP